MRKLNIDRAKQSWLGIPASASDFYYTALLACLQGNKHKSGCVLKIIGDFNENLELYWTGNLDQRTLSFWKNRHLATEYGAIAIAAFLIEAFTDLEFLEIMEIGEGADFFLCEKQNATNPSFKQNPIAKLEVSGIWNEKLGNTVNMRINIKKKQVEKGSFLLPIYIIVVEFGSLKAKFIKK